MATEYRAVGKEGYVSFQGTEVSADYRNFDIELMLDTVEMTAGSEGSKSYIGTLKDGTAKLTYAYSGTAGTAYSQLLRVGQAGTLVWGPEGTAAGNPKGSVKALVVNHSKPMTYNDLIVRSATFQFTGDLIADDEVDVFP
jgi:hypothetical protein